jgi:tetratricopeptide (TPR) repeat protein
MPVKKNKKPPARKPGTKPLAGKNTKAPGARNGRPAKPVAAAAAPPPPPKAAAPDTKSDGKLQYKTFERAIHLLHKRNFREAKELFEKARQGPNLEMATNAQTHVRMCERRLAAPLPEPKSAEEHYNYGVALINLRSLDQARKHLVVALDMEPRADHVHYALGVCLALSGDAQGAYDSLRRAIELQPRNRMAARQDSDLDAVSNQPRFSRLLYPDNA